MAHYTFESLHPFHDGNGRVGRLLIVLTLLGWGVISEPTLTVSPWFETRRQRYYDALLGVSARGDWTTWVTFFADGLSHSADETRRRMVALADVHKELQDQVHRSNLRSTNAIKLLDLAVASPSFSINNVVAFLGIKTPGAKKLVDNLIELGVLAPIDDRTYARRFHAPRVMAVLLGNAG